MRARGLRPIALVGLLVALAPTRLPAQRVSTRTELLRLEDGWATALVRRDTAYFRRTLAPGFIYSEDDRSYSRDEVLRDLLSPSDTITDARNEDMAVHAFGATAVVTGWLVVRGRSPTGPFERRYRFTDTWVRQTGRWRIVAAHDYLVPRK